MADDKPALVINEPLATGWLRTDLSGNLDAARAHVYDARRLLGALRTHYGVNERIAAGLPGGYYFDRRTLPDGTVIEAFTNDGHDHIRVHAPPPPTTAGSDKDELPETPDPLYMWVGIKSLDPDVPWYGVNGIMVEPEGGDTQGIVTSLGWWEVAFIGLEFSDDEAAVTGDGGGCTTFDEAIAQQYARWVGPGPTGALYPLDMAPGQHSIMIDDRTFGGIFMASKNGLRCYAVGTYQDGKGISPSDDPYRWMPFDPLLPIDEQAGERTYGDRDMDPGEHIPERAWDVVYVLDPGEAHHQFPFDPRAHIHAARKALQKDAGMVDDEKMVLHGDYKLATHLMGYAPELYSTRGGQEIPGTVGLLRNNVSDYEEYLRRRRSPSSALAIEVRLGKGEKMAIHRFETYIEASSDELWHNQPFGYSGLNPAGKNFSQDLLAIDVHAKSARFIGAPGQLEPILGGAPYDEPGDPRRQFIIFVYGDYGVGQVAQSDYANVAARAVYDTLEEATAAAYSPVRITYHSVADIMTAAEVCTKGSIWAYHPMSNTFEQLPVISTVEQYQDWYDDTPNSILQPYWYWWWPYQGQCYYAGIANVGILLGPDGWEKANGNMRMPWQ